jgi:nucleoside-diphosphate-sugar epimerase
LTRQLVKQGAEVSILVRPDSDLWRLESAVEHVNVIRTDLSDIDDAAPALKTSAPEIVFHLAWHGVGSADRNDPGQVRNVTGSLKLFDMVRQVGCRCWVGVGSQAEYGSHHDGALTEEISTRPVTMYGVSKLAVGMLTRQLCSLAGMRYLWFRLLATYGPKDDERHLIPAVIRQLLAAKRPALTPGEQRWDYLYVEDAAEAIWRAATDPTVQGVFNLGSGEAYAVREIVERVRDMIDPSLPLGFGEVQTRADQIMYLQADISKLCAATDWMPRITLDNGLKKTVDWYRAQQRLTGSQ